MMPWGSFASFSTEYCSPGNRFRPTWATLLMTRISHFLGRPLAVPRFKILHIVDQPRHARQRHRVVARRAHAADRSVAFELHHAALSRAFQDRAVQLGLGERDRHVHARAILF